MCVEFSLLKDRKESYLIPIISSGALWFINLEVGRGGRCHGQNQCKLKKSIDNCLIMNGLTLASSWRNSWMPWNNADEGAGVTGSMDPLGIDSGSTACERWWDSSTASSTDDVIVGLWFDDDLCNNILIHLLVSTLLFPVNKHVKSRTQSWYYLNIRKTNSHRLTNNLLWIGDFGRRSSSFGRWWIINNHERTIEGTVADESDWTSWILLMIDVFLDQLNLD